MATYKCPNPACTRTEEAGKAPHHNPCPPALGGCNEPVGRYVLPEPAVELEAKAKGKRGK
ncbi:MAG: hypothetical protein ABR586_01290 [Thermoplasmatota archaeon]